MCIERRLRSLSMRADRCRVVILVYGRHLRSVAILQCPCVRALAPRQFRSLLSRKHGLVLLVSKILLPPTLFLDCVSILLFAALLCLAGASEILGLHFCR